MPNINKLIWEPTLQYVFNHVSFLTKPELRHFSIGGVGENPFMLPIMTFDCLQAHKQVQISITKLFKDSSE